MSDCPTAEDLEHYVAGLSAEEEVARHVVGCADCRDKVERSRANNSLISELVVATGREQGKAAPLSDAIPGYRILSTIGHGGQGVVYQARQLATKRTVALKVLIGGVFVTPRRRERFQREIELAASLRHPNIVTIYDSGVTPDGRCYCAMEHIDGVPLNEHVGNSKTEDDEGRLTIEGTLSIFVKVCEAVNVAHLRGIVHRDLKPGNILVDATGEPHVLDFGLAKLTGTEPLADGGSVSLTGEFMGTFAYAAPEQTLGRPDAIDVRTDVYALGVILFELLTGGHPYSLTGSMGDMIRTITEVEPAPPSTLRRDIDDELDTIVLKALAKEPERRYQSASELLRDVKRYQSGEPIDAKRDSTWYVLRKTVFRHRQRVVLAATVALLLLVSLAAVAAYSIYSARAAAAKVRALAESERAEAISLVLHSASGPRAADSEPQAYPLRDLERLNEQIRLGWLSGNQLRESATATLLAAVYRETGAASYAEELLRQVTVQRMLNLGPDHQDAARAMYDLAEVLLFRNRLVEAIRYCERARAVDAKVYGDDSLEIARDDELRARILLAKGDYHSAARMVADAVAIQLLKLGKENTELAQSLDTRSAALFALGDIDAAESDCLRSLRLRFALLQDEHPAVAKSLRRLAAIMNRRTGDALGSAVGGLAKGLAVVTYNEIANHLTELVADLERLAAPDGNNPAIPAEILRSLLVVKESILGPDHLGLLSTLSAMTVEARTLKDNAAEESTLARAQSVIEKNGGAKTLALANCLEERAMALVELDRYAEAITALERSVEIWWALPADRRDDFQAAVNERVLAWFMTQDGRYEDAERRYQHCIEIIGRAHGPDHHIIIIARSERALALMHLGHLDEAEKEAREALVLGEQLTTSSPNSERMCRLKYILGSTLVARGKFDEAEPLIKFAWEGENGCGAVRIYPSKDRSLRNLVEDMIKICIARHDVECEAMWRKELR